MSAHIKNKINLPLILLLGLLFALNLNATNPPITPLPCDVVISPRGPVFCSGETIKAVGTPGGGTYVWLATPATLGVATGDAFTFTNNTREPITGTLKVTYTAPDGCVDTDEILNVEVTEDCSVTLNPEIFEVSVGETLSASFYVTHAGCKKANLRYAKITDIGTGGAINVNTGLITGLNNEGTFGFGVYDTADAYCQSSGLVNVKNIRIVSVSIPDDSIVMNLLPANKTGTLTVYAVTTTGTENLIKTVPNRAGGSGITMTLPRDSIPTAKYSGFKIKWAVTGNPTDDEAYLFRALGTYRHSQYNIPNETSCTGAASNVYITNSSCNFAASTLKSDFKSQTRINGSGISINHGSISLEDWCINTWTGTPPADARGGSTNGNSFRPKTPTGSCNGRTGTLNPTTVAIHPNHPYLVCSEEIYISSIGFKTVTDTGSAAVLVEAQCDNFTNQAACAPGTINDLGNFKTFIIGDSR